MKDLVQWQIRDEQGIVMPWFTHPFLAELKTWDLSQKRVLEYGCGHSTIWWASRAKRVTGIESNEEWFKEVWSELEARDLLYKKAYILLSRVREGDPDPEKKRYYFTPPLVSKEKDKDIFYTIVYDIIVIDGIHRYECLQWAEKYFKQHGGIIIFDNWQQDGFICPACEELMKPYEQYVFPQPGHTDHHGNGWKTAFFIIPIVTN